MINLSEFIPGFAAILPAHQHLPPWEITQNLKTILPEIILQLGSDYIITDGVAVHKTALIEQGVVLKSPVIINQHCFVGAHAYFREGVFLADGVKIGPGCEIKNSIICANTAIAHFNYIGNSIIGENINFEAGAIAANHYNERTDKNISVLYKGQVIDTRTTKFGALVGDNSKIGANAVLSPGTILGKNTIVKRLQLIEQYVP